MSVGRFKPGDKVRVTSGACGSVDNQVDYLIITALKAGYYTYASYTEKGEKYSNCSGCLEDHNLELYGATMEPTTRRTFRLKKDSPTMMKGAILQEQCDDGTQPYIMLNQSTHCKDPSYSISIAKRELVEEQPSWFEEVFQVEPQFMTRPELDLFDAFKAQKLKGKKVTKK